VCVEIFVNYSIKITLHSTVRFISTPRLNFADVHFLLSAVLYISTTMATLMKYYLALFFS